MKRFVVFAMAALASLVLFTPSTWATETTIVRTAGLPTLEADALFGGIQQDVAAPAVRPCEDELEAVVVAGTAWACNYGAPSCAWSAQCDSWCWPLHGLCLTGCCACQ